MTIVKEKGKIFCRSDWDFLASYTWYEKSFDAYLSKVTSVDEVNKLRSLACQEPQ